MPIEDRKGQGKITSASAKENSPSDFLWTYSRPDEALRNRSNYSMSLGTPIMRSRSHNSVSRAKNRARKGGVASSCKFELHTHQASAQGALKARAMSNATIPNRMLDAAAQAGV